MQNKAIMFGVLMLMIFAVSAASADNKVYLDPIGIDIPDCGTKDVSLMLNSSDGVAGFQADIKFDSTVAEITNVVFSGDYNNMFSTATPYSGYYRVIGVNGVGDTSGEQTLATLTISCVKCDDSSHIEFTEENGMVLQIANFSGAVLPATWTGSPVACGPPPTDDCLGDCYNATGGLIASNVPCYDCIGIGTGVSWKNYPCPAGTGGCTCPEMPHEICPQCCDGIDNDGADGTDWPADPKCGCCIDGNETDGTDPCPPPCVPELPTLALAGIGILGIALLARKRE